MGKITLKGHSQEDVNAFIVNAATAVNEVTV